MARGLQGRAPKKVHQLSELRGKHHAHRCTTCGLRFSDRCRTPHVDHVCPSCLGGHQRPLWDRNHDPRDCCVGNSPMILDVDTRVKYRLGGPGPWYQCRTCSRTHPSLPRRNP